MNETVTDTKKGVKMFEFNDYKLNDKGQSQVVFKEIYKEGTYLNSAHYQINHPKLENVWGCQESEWNYNAEVSVEKNGVAKDVYAGQFQKEDKEIYTINFYKQFHTDRSTSVALNLDKEQLEQIVEQAQKLLAE